MGPALELLQRDVPGPRRPAAPAASQRLRIVEGALDCLARQGLSKTTLEDVARAAGCSRATVYRAFPGGKDAVMAAVVETELSRLFSALAVAMGEAEDVEEVLVAGMTLATLRIGGHEALGFVLEHEPEVVLAHLAFEHHDAVLAAAASFAAPFLGRWLDHDAALRVAELAARIVLSYLSCPAEGIDLGDRECARHIVGRYVLPGVRCLAPDSLVGAGAGVPAGPRPTHLVPTGGRRAHKGEAS